ncbi:MAG: glycosyltransferase [Bacteroidota bacterium]
MTRKQINIAVLCGPENGSPRVLAETLNAFLLDEGHASEINFRVKALTRLLPARMLNYNRWLTFFYKAYHYIGDRRMFSLMRKKDAVILCGCTPYAFYSDSYHVERFRKIIKKPVLYYAVQYLENAPTIVERLKAGKHAGLERYDWHLTVSPVTEVRHTPAPPWSRLGLYLKSTGLEPVAKEEFFAVVDFSHPGYEAYREEQISALKELGIPYISLEKRYTLAEIRELYKKAAVYFMQSTEAYGMPIAECLACGSYIFTPDTSWPMSWRLDEHPEVHGPGTLPGCFVVYNDPADLRKKLLELRDNYDTEKTPREVFDIFHSYYPSFYEGDRESLEELMGKIREGKLVRE